MISPISQTLDDNDLDDDALWAAIDSAAATSSSSLTTTTTKSLKPQSTKNRFKSPKITFPIISSPSSTTTTPTRKHLIVTDNVSPVAKRVCGNERGYYPLAMVSTPKTMVTYGSEYEIRSPGVDVVDSSSDCSVMMSQHSLSGRFPTVAVFKEYQNAAMAILEKGDYTMISGNPFIKKSGWRKISFYFNISYEIKDKTIEFDDDCNVQRAEFIVRAHMQGGRFSDGWGSCERREKRFSKPNHDIPSTAETRAKNKACQDLLGIGEYRPGVNSQR